MDFSQSNTALLVVDVQKLFTDQFKDSDRLHKFLGSVSDVLSSAREQLPADNIIHIRANYTGSAWVPVFTELNPDKPVYNNDDVTAEPRAQENPGEILFAKKTFDAFNDGYFIPTQEASISYSSSPLSAYLKSRNIHTVYVIGMVTAGCVHHTAHGAFARGFKPILISGACLDRTEERQELTFKLYGGYIYQVI